MLAHDFAGTLSIIEKARIGDLLFELGKSFPFTLNEKIEVHFSAAALCERRKDATVTDRRDKEELTSATGARGLRAAVAFREFFHAPRGINELLLTGEKRVACGTDADFNVSPGRAGMIHRATGAHDIGLCIFRMNVRFHVRKGAPNLRRMGTFRKR
jgi:hypothetical protein